MNSKRRYTHANASKRRQMRTNAKSKNYQTPPSYGFGRYGFGFFRSRIAFRATGALWGRSTPFFYHFSVHLNSVLGRTELCYEVWTPGPQKTQIISNEKNHLALSGITPPFAAAQAGNGKRPGSRVFKKLSGFGNSSLQGCESTQNICSTVFRCNHRRGG